MMNQPTKNKSRRAIIQSGAAAMASALIPATVKAAPVHTNPLDVKTTHHFGKAKHVIFLFMEGGPSHLDLFDHKPLLNKLDGQKLPPSFKPPITAMGQSDAPILAAPRKWKQNGESGIWTSEWIPHISGIVDDISVIHSCMSNGINHAGGTSQMNTGSIFGNRPSLGAWVTYALGSKNPNLPPFIVLKDRVNNPIGGLKNWGTNFMPAIYQGVPLNHKGQPIKHLAHPSNISASRHQNKLDFINKINEEHYNSRTDNSDLYARMKSYDLTQRLQKEAPEALDISKESEATKEMYGVNNKVSKTFAENCIKARRLVEHGVRFSLLYNGSGSGWDSHSKIEDKHPTLCQSMDQPIAALIKDLKQRGLFEETLVVWGGEFGRTPMSEGGTGRDHNHNGFTMWMAGGGVKGGQTIGKTDELGLYAIEDKMHVHDIHSTIMHLLGVDHTKLIYKHQGRPERIDMNEGHVNHKIFT